MHGARGVRNAQLCPDRNVFHKDEAAVGKAIDETLQAVLEGHLVVCEPGAIIATVQKNVGRLQ